MNKFLLSNFIKEEDFKKHVSNTILKYEKTLKSINLIRFNKNVVDPIKLTFDKYLFKKSIEEIINDEISRQRDKSNNNSIGYFHQNIFKYIKGCEVPKTGFDIIFTRPNGSKINVEMKNKHNTMNFSAAQKTYINMQNKILSNPNDECYLVEVIAPHSRNIEWELSLDGNKVSDKRIRRVSIDKFYEIVTGIKNAFMLLCEQLPITINEIVNEHNNITVEKDTAIEELRKIDSNLLKALFLSAFKTYEGFDEFTEWNTINKLLNE